MQVNKKHNKMRRTHILEYIMACAVVVLAATALPTEVVAEASEQSQSVVEVKTLTFENKTHDFGKITEEDGAQSCVFKYKNNTDKPLFIQKVIVSCACTQVEWSGKPVRPKESGEIKVFFSNRIGKGIFDKTISVYVSSCPFNTILRVKGEVVSEKEDE